MRHTFDATKWPGKELLARIQAVKCTVIEKDGSEVGIFPGYMRKSLASLRRTGLYGPAGGVRRVVRDIFELYDGEALVAFAVVCDHGGMFHRMRQAHVLQSVHLALLCGAGASLLMHAVMGAYPQRWITLDSLSNALGFYLRREFRLTGLTGPTGPTGLTGLTGRPVVMIDTPKSFALSLHPVDAPRESDEMQSHLKAMLGEIKHGEGFVPPAERAFSPDGAFDASYWQAHLAYPPQATDSDPVYVRVCYTQVRKVHKEAAAMLADEPAETAETAETDKTDKTDETLGPRTPSRSASLRSASLLPASRRSAGARGLSGGVTGPGTRGRQAPA